MSLDIANTILETLGGGRFIAMTGARDFVGTDCSLHFRLPARFAAKGINKVAVTLTPADLYRVDFYKLERHGVVMRSIASIDGVFVDQLRRVFTAETGLDCSL